MQTKRFFGLRFRLTALVLLAVLPVLALIIFTHFSQRQAAAQRAESDVQRLSGLVASDLSQFIEGAQQLLVGLAELPEVRSFDGEGCSELFSRLVSENSRYVNLRAVQIDGEIYCSALLADRRPNQADQIYFQNVVRDRRFTVGEFQMFFPPGLPVLTFAYPVLDDRGNIQSILTADIDLSWLDQVGMRFVTTPGSAFTVIDRYGMVLSRYPEAGLVGRTLPDTRLIGKILEQLEGTVQEVGLDGIHRIYAFNPVEGSENSVFVAIGIPSQEVFAQSNQNLVWSLALLVLVSLLALLLSSWFGRVYILEPVTRLIRTTNRLAEGDLSARSNLVEDGEIGLLASSFDEMAAALELRSRALMEAEANFRTLVEQLPAVAYRSVPDERSTLLYVSPQLQNVTGHDPEEWLRDPDAWARCIHPDDRERVLHHLLENYQAEEPFSIEYRLIHKDGREMWIRHEGVMVRERDGAPAIVHGLLQDVTERRDLLEILRQERDTLTRVMETSPAGILLFDQTGQTVYANRRAETILGVEYREIQRRPYNHPAWNILDEEGRSMPDEELPFRQAIKQRDLVSNVILWIENPSSGRLLLRTNAVPLFGPDGEITGVVTSLEDITAQYRRQAELEALVDVAAAVRNTETLEGVIPVVLSELSNLLQLDGASLGMHDPVTGDMVFKMGVGAWSSVAGQRLPAGEGITSLVVKSGQPYWNNDIQKETTLVHRIFSGKLPAGACLPLNAQGQSIGVIWMGRNDPFQAEDVRLATGIVDIAASAVHRAALLEETQRRLERITGLHSIDIAITSSVDLQVVLSIILDEVISQLQVEAADILLMNPDIQVLTFAAGRGMRSNVAQSVYLRLGDGMAGQAALKREVILCPDLARADVPPIFEEVIQLEGVRAYFAAPLVAKSQVKGVLELFHRQPFYPSPEWIEFLNTLATQAAIAIDNSDLFYRLQRSNEELTLAYDATIKGWSEALELRDQETRGHADRVTDLAVELAERMGIRGTQLAEFRRGVLLHDVGKMGIPDSILLKEGPLDDNEWTIMRQHPEYAYRLLAPIPYLRHALDIPYSHHEWWDGSGYPKGLRQEQIPLGARIFSVVDVWDALTNDRPYRRRWEEQRVRNYIASLSGTHFDPAIVRAFFQMLDEQETGGSNGKYSHES